MTLSLILVSCYVQIYLIVPKHMNMTIFLLKNLSLYAPHILQFQDVNLKLPFFFAYLGYYVSNAGGPHLRPEWLGCSAGHILCTGQLKLPRASSNWGPVNRELWAEDRKVKNSVLSLQFSQLNSLNLQLSQLAKNL
jgi:hypothetical protein